MKTDDGWKALAALRDRYSVELDTRGWESEQLPGGVALPDDLIDALREAAQRLQDEVVEVYELESTHKEFEPMTVRLNREGFRALKSNLMSHFDLVMVPTSRMWALVMSHEMDGIVLGPRSFLAAICTDQLSQN